MVPDPHARAAHTTHDASLQQCGALTGHRSACARTERKHVLLESNLIVFVFVPGDVARVGVGDQHWPILARDLEHARLRGRRWHGSIPAESKRTGVAGVVEDLDHPAMVELAPKHLAFADAATQAPGECQPLALKPPHDR